MNREQQLEQVLRGMLEILTRSQDDPCFVPPDLAFDNEADAHSWAALTAQGQALISP